MQQNQRGMKREREKFCICKAQHVRCTKMRPARKTEAELVEEMTGNTAQNATQRTVTGPGRERPE